MASLITRGNIYYAQYMSGKKAKRISLETDSLQVAKEKIRQLESAFYLGNDNPLPTKTPIDKVVTMQGIRPRACNAIPIICEKRSAPSVLVSSCHLYRYICR